LKRYKNEYNNVLIIITFVCCGRRRTCRHRHKPLKMKYRMLTKYLVLVVAILLASGCSLSDPRLMGTWKSDLDLTKQYNKKHAKLSKKQEKAISQLFGIMEVTYNSNRTCVFYFQKHTIQAENDVYECDSSKSVGTYKILFKDDNIVVVQFEEDNSEKSVSVITFVDENTYWIYVGGFYQFDLHLREYFKK
jgi:hypothetical protein